ncbi:hypothetical protein TcCL_Unassigned00239 [Trypanosoma cruzi]|nr:hypothetical protein TcCL_Unassigned00239 [Trypanosoma cruzi]
MQQEGEGRGTADAARESRQNEERAAGPAAQFTHHETASTTISPSSFPLSQRNGKSTAATTQRTRSKHPPHEAEAEAKPHPSMTWQQNFSHPALNGTRNPTQRSHTQCITPAGKETRAAHSLSSLLLMPRKKTTAATRNRQHALQKEHPNPLQCASCVRGRMCLQKRKAKKKRGSRVCVKTHKLKMYSGDAWRKQQEEDRSNP